MTSTDPLARPLNRILLTGAAGGLGKVLRTALRPYAHTLRLSDVASMAPAEGRHEEVRVCNLADKEAVDALVDGVEAIVHLGGISTEHAFEEIIEANIRGTYHVYEAARRHGVRRIVFASSNHVIGFYKQDEHIDALAPRRPDSYYGLSKAFGEDLANFYHDRYGIETVSIRIGSSFPEPLNRRMMSTWMSYRDLTQLVERALFTPSVGHMVVYGMSDNKDIWWDNHCAAALGFAPQDSSEPFRAKVESQPAPAADDPNSIYQGGAFTASGPFESIQAKPAHPSSGAELVLNAHNSTGESPVWHVAEQALYWVDIPARALHRWQAAGQRHDTWYANEQISCIARAPQGQWIAGMESGVFMLTPGTDGRLSSSLLAQAAHARPGMRFNDGRCDRQGRLWAGTMLLDMPQCAPVGALYRLNSQGAECRLEQVIDDLIVPNGIAFSPDGRTMYLSDSSPSRQIVWAFDYDTETGIPSNRRIFIDKLASGRPDGAAIDEDGGYWICGNDSGQIHRYTPDGRLDRSLSVPVAKPAMCAFGGANLDTLFVTSIRLPSAAPDALDGGVFALRPGVRGIEEPAYQR